MASRRPIIPDMPVFGSDGVPVGIVHHVARMRIVLNRIGASEAHVRTIPLDWVAGVSDRVILDRPASQVRETEPEPFRLRSLVPAALALLLVAATLVLGVRALIQRDASNAVAAVPAAMPSAAVAAVVRKVKTVAARVPVVAAVAPVAPGTTAAGPSIETSLAVGGPASAPVSAGSIAAGPDLAGSSAMAGYLESDAAVPRTFLVAEIAGRGAAGASPDPLGIGPLAQVMATHLNTRIKLAVLPGGGPAALRRARAMQAALVARGIPAYRIAVGGAGGLKLKAKTGVAVVVLAK